jgi:BirA family transcriptional regulator, biotin operon repressor / biotin---[acetyl-CoA-carboxylase] ligase
MLNRIAQWNRGENFPSIRADWLAYAGGLGTTIRVRLADREIVGQFEALDETGRLVLLMRDGSREVVSAGDVMEFAGHRRTAAGDT